MLRDISTPNHKGDVRVMLGHRRERYEQSPRRTDVSDQPEQPLEDQVQHRVENQVAWITLNRPEVRNAVTPDQRNRVIDLMEEASASLDVRAVVLTATGKGFCTGADLRGGT